MFERFRTIFIDNSKNIKFYALMFLVIFIICIAVSPSASEAVTEMGKVAKKCVCFPTNPVTHIYN